MFVNSGQAAGQSVKFNVTNVDHLTTGNIWTTRPLDHPKVYNHVVARIISIVTTFVFGRSNQLQTDFLSFFCCCLFYSFITQSFCQSLVQHLGQVNTRKNVSLLFITNHKWVISFFSPALLIRWFEILIIVQGSKQNNSTIRFVLFFLPGIFLVGFLFSLNWLSILADILGAQSITFSCFVSCQFSPLLGPNFAGRMFFLSSAVAALGEWGCQKLLT